MRTSTSPGCSARRGSPRRRRCTGGATSSSISAARGPESHAPTSTKWTERWATVTTKATTARGPASEGALGRRRRPRARPRVEDRPEPAARPPDRRSRQSRDCASRGVCRRQGQRDRRPGRPRRAREGGSGRGRPRATALARSRRSPPRGQLRRVRPQPGGGPARELQGVFEGPHGALRHPDGPLRDVPGRGGRAAVLPGAGRTAGGQDRRPRRGPNTGGMGAYSPAPLMDAATERRVMDEIVMPTIAAMAKEGAPYAGVLYIGLMISREGPRVVEFNCRFGDPECQAIVPRLEDDILPLFDAVARGRGLPARLRWRAESSLCVVLASHGYPGR